VNNTFDFKSEKLKQMIEFLSENPNVFTVRQLAEKFGVTHDAAQSGIRRGRQRYVL